MVQGFVFAGEWHSESDNRFLTLLKEGLQEAGPVGIGGSFSRPRKMGEPVWDLS